MNIVIIAFNCSPSSILNNGPGICLANFIKILKSDKNFNLSVFTEVASNDSDIELLKSQNFNSKIKNADIIIHWSGLTPKCLDAILLADYYKNKDHKKYIILGPNLIDTVEFEKEKKYLDLISFKKILTVNERLKYLISEKHNIPLEFIDVFMVGPSLDLWQPLTGKEKDNTILWKGNSKQFVKDIDFALELENKLKSKYKFKFIGYPKQYKYYEHIDLAKKSKIYITTSLSETMGVTLLESWCSGLPSISHPKIYLHGQNYQTGIITNKTINDYTEAIDEIMSNDQLYEQLSIGAIKFVNENFSEQKILNNFRKILDKAFAY